jgi:hypothetical protein
MGVETVTNNEQTVIFYQSLVMMIMMIGEYGALVE